MKNTLLVLFCLLVSLMAFYIGFWKVGIVVAIMAAALYIACKVLVVKD